jgi:hypothetical protein
MPVERSSNLYKICNSVSRKGRKGTGAEVGRREGL